MTNAELKIFIKSLIKLHEVGAPQAAYEVLVSSLDDLNDNDKRSSRASKKPSKDSE